MLYFINIKQVFLKLDNAVSKYEEEKKTRKYTGLILWGIEYFYDGGGFDGDGLL